MSKPIDPTWTEFSEKLRAWKHAVVEWLGLDPAEVIDVDAADDMPWGYGSVAWEAVTLAEPSRGRFERFDCRGVGDGPPVYTGYVHLDYDDGVAMLSAIGPKPRIMSAADEARLARAAFGIS